ncbi:COX15/CtaA family protein [Streptomyces roseus]|uniref:COX15/CtaA family protein n=1 Tax=Streptomyces roseus TaxID=66430 RepID=UPI000B24ECE3
MCTGETLAPTAEMGVHGAIEFGNRLLTGALCAVVGWVVITARLQKRPMPAVLRGGWAQFWIVVLNAVVGGVTVWMRLSPYIVAAHFLAATLLLTAAVYTGRAASADPDAEGSADAQDGSGGSERSVARVGSQSADGAARAPRDAPPAGFGARLDRGTPGAVHGQAGPFRSFGSAQRCAAAACAGRGDARMIRREASAGLMR